MSCIAERTKDLLESSFTKRQHDLLIKIRDIKGEMNARGVLNSSMCVNEVCRACVTELQEFSDEIFFELKRSNKSCGGDYSKSTKTKLTGLFEDYLRDTKAQLSSVQEQSVGNIARHLQNKNLIQFEWLDEELGRLLIKYQAEMAMYIDTLHLSSGSNLVDRLKNSFFNNRLIAIGVLVIGAIVAIGTFTGALQSISGWISVLLK